VKKAIIIGAGVSGLVCAKELLEKGVEVAVYESNSIPGGLARTEVVDGYHLDLGPHIYHTFSPDIIDYWNRNFPNAFRLEHFWCKNVVNNEYYDYPFSYESISRFPQELKKKIVDELRSVDPVGRKEAKNYRDYIRALVGPTLQEMFYRDYPEKIWGIPVDRLSANWAPKRIEFREKYQPFHYKQWSGVGIRGSGTITDELYEIVKRLGGMVYLNHHVAGIEVLNNRISNITFTNGKKIDVTPNTAIISTISITKLCNLLKIDTTLSFRAIVLVYLTVKRPMVLPEGISWLCYHSKDIIFHRVSELNRFYTEGLPENRTVLCFEIACDKDGDIYSKPDEELIELTKEHSVSSGLITGDEIEEGYVKRLDEVYPSYSVGYEVELERVKSILSSISNLYFIGSLAEYAYTDIQACFAKAIDLAGLLTDKQLKLNKNVKLVSEIVFNKTVMLGEKIVGDGHPTYIIAEAGLNHNGDIQLAKRLIEKAALCGCDAIKFQTYKAESRVSAEVKAARYVEKTIGLEESSYEMLKRLELSESDFHELFDYARKIGIEFISTPFDEESADLLDEIGVRFFKIASFDLVNLKLLEHVALKGKPMIVSTGMASLGDIEEALEIIFEAGNRDVVLLHCVSNYPTPPEDVNLLAIRTMKEAFRLPVGFSDHTIGLLISNAAIALGANLIERHFTLDRTFEGPDHILSSEPEEMKTFVRNARILERAKGTGIKRPRPNEYETINTFRKGLFARIDIPEGTKITPEMVTIKGPGYGLLPKYYDIVVGRTARRDIKADHPITWEDI
jgi:N-acetylneuraminate synthase